MNDTISHYEPTPALTLVALAALLLKRWRLMIACALTVFVPFALYGVFFTPEKVQYTTLYQLAERDAHTPLRPIPDTQRRIESVYARNARENLGVGFGVSAAHPRHSLLISLRTVTAPGASEQVRAFHEHIIDTMEVSDRERLDSRRQALQHAAVFRLHSEIEGATSLSSAQEARMGEVLLSAAPGQASRMSQPWVWPALGAILGLIAAVVAASLASFAASVARFLREPY